jgi:agmatine/peptidylarginine deiminase
MRYVFILTVFFLLSSDILSSVENLPKKIAKEKLNSFKENDFHKLQKSKNIPIEKLNNYNEIYNKVLKNKITEPKVQSKVMEMDSLPTEFRTPGEFEESQAVLISWPSYAYNSDGEFVETFTPGVGILWTQDEFGNWNSETTDIEGYLLDLESDSPYANLWAELTNAIQQEVPVWIRVAAPEDTTLLKEFVKTKGYELYNYVFKFDEDGENAFWARDFGPFGIYYGDKDSLMFVIAEYYPGRPIDDMYPVKLSQELGYKYYKSQLELEGGNFMTDGHGNGFFGNVIYINNSDNMGTGYTNKNPMKSNNVNDEISKIFSLDNRILMVSLRCDGGTGHIDIYSKMANDQEILITKYPNQFNTMQFPDYLTVNNNRQLIESSNTIYGNKFKFLEVPLPTDDNGIYARTTCNSFNQDARGYINGLTINKTFIVPTYSNTNSGNKSGDDAALDIIRGHMPGYKVVPIDSRILTPLGGAIHCITMQIPAENPVLIKHVDLKGQIYKNDILVDGNKIEIKGSVRNHSGFVNSKIYYKKLESTEWTVADLTLEPIDNVSKTDFNFSGEININTINSNIGDKIVYYLEFETNNGKVAHRPITAPVGYNTFYLSDTQTDVENLVENQEVKMYPNPANDIVYITTPDIEENLKIEISDLMGNIIINYDVNERTNIFALDVSNYNSGMYLCKIQSSRYLKVTKFVVSK